MLSFFAIKLQKKTGGDSPGTPKRQRISLPFLPARKTRGKPRRVLFPGISPGDFSSLHLYTLADRRLEFKRRCFNTRSFLSFSGGRYSGYLFKRRYFERYNSPLGVT